MSKRDLTTDEKIDRLTTAMEKIIVAPVAPVLPVAAVAPVLPVAPINTQDHDNITILIGAVQNLDKKVDDKFKDIKTDILSIKDGTATTLQDHETRIRKDETNITQIRTYGTVLVFVAGAIEAILIRFLFR